MFTEVATMRLAFVATVGCVVVASSACEGPRDDRCQALVARYAQALPSARSCTAGEICAKARPQVYVEDGLESLGCSVLVTDAGAATLDVILGELDAAGCPRLALPCPLGPLPTACVDGSCP